MKLVRDLKEIGSSPDIASIIVVIPGEGRTEGRALPPFCSKYNGRGKFLWFPEPSKRKKQTGFTALNAIRAYIIKYEGRVRRFLFLVDREHFIQHRVKEGEEQDKIRETLESKKELKARIKESIPLSPHRAFMVKGDIEAFPFEVCIVIFGKTKNIEEELSELIRLKWGNKVEPNDQEIKKFLRSKGGAYKERGYETLIKMAGKKYLEEAFPGLCNALQKIEEDC